MNDRVLVIGLDGFEQSIAERLVKEGRMPNLQNLIERSAKLELEHGVARRTGLAWEHFATGLSPDGARRWSAVTFDPSNYRCKQEPTRLKPFPASFDFSTVVFDTPYFNLKETPDIKGFVSWGAHDPGIAPCSNPDALYGEILEKFGAYPAKPWIYGFVWPSTERTQSMGEALSEAALLRAQIAKWLLSERFTDWSLGIVVVSELHSAIEALWHGIDDAHPLYNVPSAQCARISLELVYEAVDQLLGVLTESFPECLHVIFSMHGMGPNSADVPAMALLPEYLYRRHFGRPHIREFPDLETSINRMCSAGTPSWTRTVADHWIKKHLPGRILKRIRTAFGNHSKGANTISLSWMPAYWYCDYWSKMPAFALPAFYDGQIRINLQGRESKGVVAIDDYDATCKAIASELSSCTDIVTGKPVVKDIVFTHPGNPMAVSNTEADIIIVWETASLGFHTKNYGNIGPIPPRRPGGHTGGAGMGLLSGPGIKAGEYGECSSFDMAPTLIEHLTGEPASGIDGQSIMSRILN